jgi:hypothetical protein
VKKTALICAILSISLSLSAKEEIEVPDVVIEGEDRSVLIREREERPGPEPPEGKIHLEKETPQEAPPLPPPREEIPYFEEEFPLSFFEASYGEGNKVGYILSHGQYLPGFHYLLHGEGQSWDGFSWEGDTFDRISSHRLKVDLSVPRERCEMGGGACFRNKTIYLPYQEKTELLSFGNIMLGGTFLPSSSTEVEVGLSLGRGRFIEEDVDAKSFFVRLDLNTWYGEIPLGVGGEIRGFELDGERRDTSSIFFHSKGLSLKPFRLDIVLGVEEHKDHPPQELRGLFKASLPLLEKGTFFLEAKRWMDNPGFASLYIQNDYMEPEEDLLPARKAEYGIGVEYHPGGSLSLEAKAFYQDSEDLIVLGDEDEDDLYSPVNLDGRILGVRSEITHYTGSRLVQRLSLLYRDPRAEEGKTIPFIPNLEVEYLLRYFTPWGLEILLNPRYSGESMDGLKDSTAKEIPSYLLVDAKISQRLLKDRLTLFIYGENILGEDYMVRRNYPGPPALFGFGLRLRF